MPVALVSHFDPSRCQICNVDFNILVAMLRTTVDRNGNLTPVGIDMGIEFASYSIQHVWNLNNNYNLTFLSNATCNVDKPLKQWLIDSWSCAHGVIQRGIIDMITDIWGKTKPIHPGVIFKRWILGQPEGTKESISIATDISSEQLDAIMNCQAPIDEYTAKKLAQYPQFKHTAELWHRMQYDFDYYQSEGVWANPVNLPTFER